MKVIAFLVMAMAYSTVTFGSDLEVYKRCYVQITGRTPNLANQLAASVKDGSKNPGVACGEILDGAQLDSTTGRLTTDSGINRLILDNFQRLHASWFVVKDIPQYGGRASATVLNVYDAFTPALYYTRSLFDSSKDASMVLKEPQSLRPIRTSNNPPEGHYGSEKEKSAYAFSNIRFAPKGRFLGITNTGLLPMNWSFNGNSGTVNFGRMYGNGILGNPVYILKTAGQIGRSDGVKVARTWARDMFKDLLCRDLPVVRAEDAMPMVRPNSNVSFRQSEACVICHTSIDRAAGTIRNLRHATVGGNVSPNIGSLFLQRQAPELPAENGWPAVVDGNYYKRPPSGHLMYRSYNGNLVNLPVANLNQLSNRLAARDDFYICTAKRYYEYFTGYVANTNDLMGSQLSADEMEHRNKVIQLGRSLRQHQDMKKTIVDILKSSQYKKSVEGS